MAQLKFRDMKTQKTFTTSNYKTAMKNGHCIASAKAPSGAKAVRFVACKK